jgi:hypothetical protein
MRLAEKSYPVGKAITAASPSARIREIRRLCDGSEHQTSIITTVQQGVMAKLAAYMFARWSQENFFKYAERELSIDRLAGYAMAPAPENQTIKNPEFVRLDNEIRRGRAQLVALQSERGRIPLSTGDTADVAVHMERCAPLDQQIITLTDELNQMRKRRRETRKRLAIKDIPEEKRPQFIAPVRTQFLNTVRITAYRAETAMVTILRKHLSRSDDGRALLQDLFTHDADLVTDRSAGTLTVRVHHFTNPQSTRAIQSLLLELNESETVYPGTRLAMRFEMVSVPTPVGQEV